MFRIRVLRHHERTETRTMVYQGQAFDATDAELVLYRTRLGHLGAVETMAPPADDACAPASVEATPAAKVRAVRRKRGPE